MDVAGIARDADRAQRRQPWTAFPVAVIKKYGDDQAGMLASMLAYYAFVAVFPMLLVLITALGLVLRHNPELQQKVLNSTLVEFPILGKQLSSNVHSLNRTGVGLVVGLLGSFYGARGVAGAAQYAFNTCWGVPFSRRPGFPMNLLRSLALLVVIGLDLVVTGFLSGLGGGTGSIGVLFRVLALAGSLAVNIVAFVVGFRLATAKEVSTRDLIPGAIWTAIVWQVLLALGGYFVSHQLRHASEVYGTFGVVLGLLAWLQLQAQLTLYAVEADVVRSRRLWPRAFLQPPLTKGDQKAYATYAQAQARRPEQRIDVDFEPTSEHE